MKALIRNKEIVLETSGVRGIDWKTGAPLTNPSWCGGPYILMENYVEPSEESGEQEKEPELILFDGKLYTREQLINLLNH